MGVRKIIVAIVVKNMLLTASTTNSVPPRPECVHSTIDSITLVLARHEKAVDLRGGTENEIGARFEVEMAVDGTMEWYPADAGV